MFCLIGSFPKKLPEFVLVVRSICLLNPSTASPSEHPSLLSSSDVMPETTTPSSVESLASQQSLTSENVETVLETTIPAETIHEQNENTATPSVSDTTVGSLELEAEAPVRPEEDISSNLLLISS